MNPFIFDVKVFLATETLITLSAMYVQSTVYTFELIIENAGAVQDSRVISPRLKSELASDNVKVKRTRFELMST